MQDTNDQVVDDIITAEGSTSEDLQNDSSEEGTQAEVESTEDATEVDEQTATDTASTGT